MPDPIIDARGLLCPQPLIMTKKALRDVPLDGRLTVLIDNTTAVENVERFIRDNGSAVSHIQADGLFTLAVVKGREIAPAVDPAGYCGPTTTGPIAPAGATICIKSAAMGIGADDLGAILMQAYINTIKAVSPLPAQIIFYNSGILLTVEGSPALPALADLEQRGVRIMVCGTCVDYYQKKPLVRVGVISNMYAILETLTSAHHVIYP
jgi:selenium metabolism protein YedF